MSLTELVGVPQVNSINEEIGVRWAEAAPRRSAREHGGHVRRRRVDERGDHVAGHKALTQVARHFGHEAEVDTKVVCVDKRRQWSRWRNVWHSSAIRSTLYTLGSPGRALKRLLKRDRSVA